MGKRSPTSAWPNIYNASFLKPNRPGSWIVVATGFRAPPAWEDPVIIMFARHLLVGIETMILNWELSKP